MTNQDKANKPNKKASIMNKSQIFKQAHAMTKKTMKKGDNYQATFSICLKIVINSQPQKTAVNSNINEGVAMVGDYKKPSIENDIIEFPFFILSAFAILIIFALTLQAINYI